VVAADQACDAFEAAWRAGQRPRLLDSLENVDAEDRAALLAELLPLDVEYRRRAGESPCPEDYTTQLPDLDPVRIARLFPAGPGAGRFRLIERVGLGACGAVWRALDTQLGRVVALKLPHPGLVSSPEALERFHREARAAAQLRHPGIVTVHEVAEHDGLPALVEDFIEGEPLRDILCRRRLTAAEAALLIARVAEAVDYAHRMGAVHRDLKPANIMVRSDESGGIGEPLVVDFGLALNSAAEITLTLEGQLVGTPAYMSPEQAGGNSHRLDRRTDIYSLGVILYETLCGELPFRGVKAVLLEQILHEEPKAPRAVDRKVPRDLDTVCLKAMAREPQHRYAAACDLADDLRRYLRGEPVRARPVGPAERAVRWVRRRPTVAALLAVSAVAAIALAGVAVSALQSARLREAITAAHLARSAEADQRARAEAGLYNQRVLLASREWSLGNVGRVGQLLEDCPPDQRGWEWRYLRGLCRGDLFTLHQPPVQPGWWTVTAVAWSPDGRSLLSGCKDGGLHLWSASGGHPDRRIGVHPGGVMAVAWSPDGHTAASAGLDQNVRIWDVATGASLRVLSGHFGHLYSVAFSPDGKMLASGGGDWLENVYPVEPGRPEIKVWDTANGRELKSWLAGKRDVVGLAFSPDGQTLASASGAWMAGPGRLVAGEATVWDPLTGKALQTLSGHTAPLSGLAFSPDGRRLLTSSWDRTLKLWDLRKGREIRTLRGHRDWVRGAAFSPDGRRIASGGADAVAKVWDANTGDEILTLRGHTQAVMSVCFSPDGRRLASAGGDQVVKVWDTVNECDGPRYTGHAGPVAALAFSPDGRYVYSAANPVGGSGLSEPEVHCWEADTAKKIRKYCGAGSAPLNALALSSDGRWLAVGRNDGSLGMWETETCRALPGSLRQDGAIRGVAFSPENHSLVSVGLRRVPANPETPMPTPWQLEVKVWDPNTLQEIGSDYDTGVLWPRTLAIHPVDGRIAVGDDKGRVRFLDPATLHQTAVWPAHERVASGLAFSPDGKRLASASWDNTVKVWDTADGRLICKMQGHSRAVVAVAFSPDGRRLASGGEDRSMKLWDADTGWETLTLAGHDDGITAIAFSPDGRRLASASLDGTVKVWHADERTERP
jgi:WD40 repeat protein